MKITEIIDTSFINTPDTTVASPHSKTGVYGSVSDDDDPFMVHKSTNRVIEDPDAYYHWVTAIGPWIKSNPYLPRVYVVNKNESTWGIKPSYKIEKLVDYTQVPIEVLVSLYYKEIPRPSDLKINDLIEYSKTEYTEAKKVLWKDIISEVTHPGNQNKNIKQAIDIIYRLISRGLGSYDLHMGNFMIRMGPVGPQIVITDPIA